MTFCKVEEQTPYKFKIFFIKDEALELHKILNYFDAKIEAKISSGDIAMCYTEFCDSIKKDFKKGLVSFDTLGINMVLTSKFANNIWMPNYGFQLDSLRNKTKKLYYNYNSKGKYFEYLKYYSMENDNIKNYYNSIIQVGGIGPSANNIMLNCKTLDFSDENIRLIFAIHWITYFSNYL